MLPMLDALALGLVVLGWALLIHHGVVHYYQGPESSAQQESVVWVGYFQLKDIEHLESWAVVSTACAIAALLAGNNAAAVGLGVAAELLVAACFMLGDGVIVPHNVANHETWIVACFASAATLVLV